MEILDRYPILAAAASFWQPGLGQILTKRILRGIIILALFWTSNYMSQIAYSFIHYLLNNLAFQEFYLLASILPTILTLFLRLAITIWATYDAYNLASQTPDIHSMDSTPNP